MDPNTPAIQVWVVHDSRAPGKPPGNLSLPIQEIVSVNEITSADAAPAARERCRILLRQPPTAPCPWVFGADDDEPPRPPELRVTESLIQVNALRAMAARENRCVGTQDLGEAVAQAAREGLRAPLTAMSPLRLGEERQLPPQPQ